MNFQFDPTTQYKTSGSLIPTGTLHHAIVTVRGLKSSRDTGGQYADVELTLIDGPFESRKVWTVIMDPSDERNSENARSMGMSALQHALEAIGVFVPEKPETYGKFASSTFAQIAQALDGKRVPIKISVQKGKDGYQDKNQVGAWLSPNPVSSTSKLYAQLQTGSHGGNVGNAGVHPQTSASFAPQQQPLHVVQNEPAGIAVGQRPHWMK